MSRAGTKKDTHKQNDSMTSTVKASVGTAVAAATLAAVTVLSGPAFSTGPAAFSAMAPVTVQSRIDGVHQDMLRAVELSQLTTEQATFLENQLVRRIQGSTSA